MESPNDQLMAHQIATIKHAAELGQSVVPYLNEMKAIIRKKVAEFDSEKRTAKRLQTMLNALANTLNKPALVLMSWICSHHWKTETLC